MSEKNGRFNHLVDHCLELYEDFKKSSYRKKVMDLIKESKKACNQESTPTNDPWPGAMNMMLPFTVITNDNLSPRLASGLVGKRPYVRFEMPNDQPKDPATEIAEAWFDQELEDVVNVEQTAIDLVEKLLEEGTVFQIPEYCLEEVTRRDFVFGQNGMPVMGKDGSPALREIREPVFEGGKIRFLDIKDVYIADNIDDEDWETEPVIRVIRPTYGELQRDKEQKGYIKENVGKELLKDEGQRKISEEDKTIDQERDDVKVTSKEVIKCIECYVSYVYQKEDEEKEDIEDWTEERLIVTIALDSKTLIRLRLLREVNWRNQHLIKRIALFRKRGESYGRPMFAKLKSIQEGANKVFNTSINVAEITMIPWYLYTDKLGLKGDVTKLIPGQGVAVDDISQIYFPRFSVSPNQLYQFLEVFSAFWERVTAIGDLQTGRTDDSKSTATEVLAVIQEGNIKHNYQSKPVRSQFMEVLRGVYDLYYQHMPLDKTFYWKGQMVPIPRAVLRRKYVYKLTASTEMSNKLIERKERESINAVAQQDKYGVWNPVWVAEQVAKSYDNLDTSNAVNPQINSVVQKLMQFPQAAQLFEQAFNEAMQTAQQIEQQGKAQGSAVVQRAMS